MGGVYDGFLGWVFGGLGWMDCFEGLCVAGERERDLRRSLYGYGVMVCVD